MQGYQKFKMSKEIIEIFLPIKIFQFHRHIEFGVWVVWENFFIVGFLLVHGALNLMPTKKRDYGLFDYHVGFEGFRENWSGLKEILKLFSVSMKRKIWGQGKKLLIKLPKILRVWFIIIQVNENKIW